MGEWLDRCGEAIYGTRICAPYRAENIAFTQNKESAFAIILDENLPESLFIPYNGDVNGMTLLNNGTPLGFEKVDGGVRVNLKNIDCKDYAYALKIEK